MPKRIVDGEGIWRSEKLATVEPDWMRAELANLIPLALANGTFECTPRQVWSRVYACNRSNITLEMVSDLLTEFERVKILFRWQDYSGKVWGFFIGIEKPGRLPGKSRRKSKHEILGADVPLPELEQFLDGTPVADQGPAVGCIGSGFGTGFGTGFGKGKGLGGKSFAHTEVCAGGTHSVNHSEITEDVDQIKRKNIPRPKESTADPRHYSTEKLIQQIHLAKFGVTCEWSGREGAQLKKLLEANSSWTQEQIDRMVRNRFDSEQVSPQRPAKWLPDLGEYASGPLSRFKDLRPANVDAGNRAEQRQKSNLKVLHDVLSNAKRGGA